MGIFLSPCVVYTAPTGAKVSYETIRVLIGEECFKKGSHTIHAEADISIKEDLHNRSMPQLVGRHLTVYFKNGSFFISTDNKKATVMKQSSLKIFSDDNHLTFNNKKYNGSITLHCDKEKRKILIINELNVEDYIYSVLRSECIPYWPFEIQKVQAVASRSYALYHIHASRIRNKLYDIKNNTLNQVYDGHHTIKHLDEAVKQTNHQILTYEHKPALTMFDICCGGVVPAHLPTADKSKPYLFRPYKCVYCKQSSQYEWSIHMPHKDFIKKLKQHKELRKKIIGIGFLKKISTQHHNKSNTTQKIYLDGSYQSACLSTKEIKAALPGHFKSPSFTIKKEKGTVKIEGRGFGHHHGLCQCGAFYMVKAGWSYKEILRFYFPRTKLIRHI